MECVFLASISLLRTYMLRKGQKHLLHPDGAVLAALLHVYMLAQHACPAMHFRICLRLFGKQGHCIAPLTRLSLAQLHE